MNYTKEQRAEILALADKATAGPWQIWADEGDHLSICSVELDDPAEHEQCVVSAPYRNANHMNDSAFITHSRADVPALIADCDELEAENASLRRQLREVQAESTEHYDLYQDSRK